jgi:hypothetical protein
MQNLLITMIVILSAGVVPATSAHRTPATPASSAIVCPPFICGTNGTQLTGLTVGDRAGAVRAIALLSGEIVALP